MAVQNKLLLEVQGTDEQIELDVERIYNAGYAGSDQAKVQEHIDELAKLGVPTPKTTPTLYPLSNDRITTSSHIQVQHGETSGEIEYVLIWAKGELFVTVGSDHTDRKLETFSVPMSKQAYPNLIPKEVWRYSDVKDHWDQIELECWMTADGQRQLYQKGTCADLLPPEKWEDVFKQMEIARDGSVFLSGTINRVTNTLKFGDHYEFTMHDPVLNRTLKHEYKAEILQAAIE